MKKTGCEFYSLFFYFISEKPKTTIPKRTNIIPVARFRVFALALFAIFAAILAKISVKRIQSAKGSESGMPPIAKCEIEPVRAVKVMIKTLVPTAVFSSYPIMLVSKRSIIIPPPAPTKPQMKPTATPQTADLMIRALAEVAAISSFVVITGFTMNLIPRKSVIITEKFPIVVEGTRLET